MTSSDRSFFVRHFRSGPKKCPKPLNFDPNCDLHMDFIVAGANLRASVYGLEGSKDRKAIAEILSTFTVRAINNYNRDPNAGHSKFGSS